ncbi:uncharacterized protein LOC144799844 isoform X2 [Lissotriton helveticus]
MASLPSAGSQGAILAFLLFQLMNPGWCQYANIAGLCRDCKGRLKQDLLPWQMKHYAHTNTKTLVCASLIRFQFGNNIVCGKSGDEWVTKLRKCIDTKDFQACKTGTTKSVTPAPNSAFVLTTTKGTELTTHHTSTSKSPNFSQKDEHKKTLDPNNDATNETKNDPLADTEMTTCPAQVTTSVGTTPSPAFVQTTDRELTSHPTATPKNPPFTDKDMHKITLEPKIDATNKNKNDALPADAELKDELKNSTPAPQTDKMKHLMVAGLSLLAVVVSLVSYVSCRRKGRLFTRKESETCRHEAHEDKYDAVKQNEDTKSAKDEAFSGH